MIHTQKPLGPKLARGFSKSVGVATAAVYVWDIGNDFVHYGGFTSDFATAAGITTATTVICIGIGIAFSMATGPAGLMILGCVALSSAVGLYGDYLKQEIIGY